MAPNKVEMKFQIEFEDITQAIIIKKALEPELITSPSERSQVKLSLDDKKLDLDIISGDVTSLRASINSYLRWIMLSLDIINIK